MISNKDSLPVFAIYQQWLIYCLLKIQCSLFDVYWRYYLLSTKDSLFSICKILFIIYQRKLLCYLQKIVYATSKIYSDCIRRESDFLALTRPVTALCVHVCCTVCVCDCVIVIRNIYAHIMQHTHTHKAVARYVEAKKLLSHQRQVNYSLPAVYKK